jgi:hypothetical protein
MRLATMNVYSKNLKVSLLLNEACAVSSADLVLREAAIPYMYGQNKSCTSGSSGGSCKIDNAYYVYELKTRCDTYFAVKLKWAFDACPHRSLRER